MRVWTIESTQRWALLGIGGLLFAASAGCTSFPSLAKSPAEPPPPASGAAKGGVVQAGYIDNAPNAVSAADPNWAIAEKLYVEQDYPKAEKKFHEVADNTKNPPMLAEKARFFEAESLRMQGHFPRSSDTFVKMLNDFPSGIYREKAVALMFQIANYWLDDTREEIEGTRKSSFWSLNSNYVHVSERSKPFLDQEGRALELLTKVHVHDPTGPYSDKALYLVGYVNFYRSNFKEADLAFTQLVEMHDRSPLRAKAAEMAIMAKNNSTGGAEYDGQKTADALRLVQQAKSTIPELVRERGDFLDRQIVAIRTQQAEKDFQAAEFYRRRGNSGSAYFYYELVMRRYPGTGIAEKAAANKSELEREIEASRSHSDGFLGEMRRGWSHYVLGKGTGEVAGEMPGGTPSARPIEAPARPVNDLPKSMPEQLKN